MVAWLAESPGAQSPLEERVAGNPGRRATSGTKRLKLVAGDQKHSTDGGSPRQMERDIHSLKLVVIAQMARWLLAARVMR